ncbi:hypothetical protein MP638_004966 [Amoeboaphelidium occidentale]|nr:hypothetical protein MP638_004966 [Amoeboaphelidium occidentale]
MNSSGLVRTLFSTLHLVSIAANEDMIFGGSRAGSIIAWNAKSLDTLFTLEDHTSQVNFLLIAESWLYSASNDKTIIKWSLETKLASIIFKIFSAATLGRLGPVNSLALCRNTLFSAGSDLTTRRWNTQTGRHEDVYFGPTRPVTSVLCYNASVFAGSEDFSVLMYSPDLSLVAETKTSTKASINTRRGVKTVISLKTENFESLTAKTSLLIGGIIAAALLIAVAVIAFFHLTYTRKKETEERSSITQNIADTATDLQTVVNTVIGISKRAAYLIETSALASTKKIAVGGGGELYLATVMDPTLRNKIGQTVIQKTVFIKSEVSKEAFYQEVGIMIMLSSFPNFCRILGYTEKPCSIVLEYYPDGSLSQWLKTRKCTRAISLKALKEISQGLNVMHSHYLAHCDLKPQNILVKVSSGIPTCFITDFGITQVLSESIIAAKSFLGLGA